MGQKTDGIFARGTLFMEKGNYEQALRLFNQVLNREPAYNEALKNKVLIYIDKKDKDSIQEVLESALSIIPQDDELKYIAGSYYVNIKSFKKGKKHLQKSVSINSENTMAQYSLGLVSANQDRNYKKAIAYFSKAIEQDPNFSKAHFSRGCSYLMIGETDLACKDLKEAHKLGHPDSQNIMAEYCTGKN